MSLFLINAGFDCLTGRFEVESTRILPLFSNGEMYSRVWKRLRFRAPRMHRKSGISARASPSPYHILLERITARFIALSFPALLATVARFPLWV